MWCLDNNLSLKVIKTKEMIVDYRKRRTEHAPFLIDGAVVQQIESIKNLGVVKRARQRLIPPQETENIWHGSSDPQISTAAPSRAT